MRCYHRWLAVLLLSGFLVVGAAVAAGQKQMPVVRYPQALTVPASFPRPDPQHKLAPLPIELANSPIAPATIIQEPAPKSDAPGMAPKQAGGNAGPEERGNGGQGGGGGAQADVTASLHQKIVIRPEGLDGEINPDRVVIDRPELFVPVIVGKNQSRPFRLSADKMTIELEGIRLGRTKIRVYDGKDWKVSSQPITVQIVADIEYLNRLVRGRFPMGNLQVTPAGDDCLFVDGHVESPADVEAVETLLSKFFAGGVVNNVRVAGGMQVQLEVVIARVDRSQLRRLGVNILANSGKSFFGTQIGGIINTPLVAAGGGGVFGPVGPAGTPLTAASTAFFGVTSETGAIYGFIEALQQKNVAKVLANPTMVTYNGRQADFLVGGQQPVPQSGAFGAPGVTFQNFGTQLNFIPTILGGGKIRLEVAPKISTLNFVNSIKVSGSDVPSFVVQQLHATVELQSGQTLCLGGLLQCETEAQSEKIPVLGSLPGGVGALFRRVRHRVVESELLILVTPRIFNPLEGCQVPEVLPGQTTVAPSDGQLYGRAMLEVYPGSAKHAHKPQFQLGDGLGIGAVNYNEGVSGGGSFRSLQELVAPTPEDKNPKQVPRP